MTNKILDFEESKILNAPPTLSELMSEPEAPPMTRRTLAELNTKRHPEVAEAVKAARLWSQLKRGGKGNASLVLLGNTGVGKTHIALACLWSMYYDLDGEPIFPVGKFFVSDQLIQRLSKDITVNILLGSAPIVVVDDVGQEREVEFIASARQAAHRQAIYFQLVNYCYNAKVSLIMTSNLSVAEFSAHIGGRCWSRLQEMAGKGCMVSMFGARDMRPELGGR